MKTARETYLLSGLVCAGLLWAGATGFGQQDPPPPFQREFPTSEPVDPAADAIGPSDFDTPTQAGVIAPARDTTQSIPGLIPGAGEPSPARRTTLQVRDEYNRLIQIPLNIGADALIKDLGAPGVTLRELQQADQQLELRINQLVELYTQAIRGEATKLFIDPSLELQYSRELGGAATEGVADPTQIREAIVALVDKQFQIRQAMRKMEISSLEERVQRLNDLLQKREEAQAKIVESRLSQLLNAAEGLGWDTAAAGGATSSRPAGVFGPGVSGPMGGYPSAAPPSARSETYDPFAPATEPAAAAPAAPAPPRTAR